eukprot:SAG22_NODE_234_length_14360_cov_13.245915_4_plen_126_part_00
MLKHDCTTPDCCPPKTLENAEISFFFFGGGGGYYLSPAPPSPGRSSDMRLRNEGKDGEGDGRSQPLTARTERIEVDSESVLILQLGEAPSSVASGGSSRSSDDEGGWPLEEMRGVEISSGPFMKG